MYKHLTCDCFGFFFKNIEYARGINNYIFLNIAQVFIVSTVLIRKENHYDSIITDFNANR